MEKIKAIFLTLFLFGYQISFCNQVEFEHLSTKDGLINSSVTSIVKDAYGYMWFGTYNGLSRYDGYGFTNYVSDPKNSQTINDNRIRFLFESKDKTLFIGFQFSGFCIYNRESETFTRFLHDPGNPNSLSHDYVFAIHEDKKGNIWIGTRGGLDKFDIKTKSFVHYNPEGQDNYFVCAIAEDEQGNLWLYGRGNYVFRFNESDHAFQKIVFAEDFNFSFSWGSNIEYDTKGNLWIGSEGGGLYRYNPVTGRKDWYALQNKKIGSNIIFDVKEDSEGRIWIATDGGGLYRYSYSTDAFEVFRKDPDDPNSISANGVYCVYESDPGIIWAGVFAGGVNVFKKDKNKFLKFTTVGKQGQKLNNRSVNNFIETEDGRIWMGTDGGGLDIYDPSTHRFTYLTPGNSILNMDKVVSMYQDGAANIWLGGYGSGLSLVNFKKGSIRSFRGNLNSRGETILSDNVWSITGSHDGKIWIGLLGFGVNVYDPVRDHFTYYVFDSTAYKKGVCTIYAIFEDSRKRIWIASESSGAGYFDPEKNTFIRFVHDEKNPASISSNFIRNIFEDSKGNLWFATIKGGLNRLVNFEKGEFEKFTLKDGLPSNNIENMLEDNRHNLWISTDKGLSLFKVSERKFVNFDIEDGLQGNEFNFHGALKAKNGNMYFGGTQGLNIFNPDSVRLNTKIPPVALTGFKIFNKSLTAGQEYNGRVYLNKPLDLLREVTLDYEDYIFSIEFAALDLTAPQMNKYAYRLKGFNDKWTYVDAGKRIATYTNLDPGEYIFEVIASNNDAIWNNEGTSLRIIIRSPWWMTWWFRSSIAVTVVIALFIFYYLRSKSVRERNSFLAKEVRKRILQLKEAYKDLQERSEEILKQQEEISKRKDELEKKKQELEHLNKTKDKFFSIIGHDLKGPVKALTSLADLLKEETPAMVSDRQKMLTNHINGASHKIHDLVVNLLEWARTQSRQVKVSPVPIHIKKIFNENIHLLSAQAAQKEIQLHMETRDEHYAFGDYNMIATVVRNILSNSIKYTPRGGGITLRSDCDTEGEIRLSIADQGIGMAQETLDKLFSLGNKDSAKGTDNETGTGLGMLIAKEFIDLNKGKIYVESTVGKGSTFYLILPRPAMEHVFN